MKQGKYLVFVEVMKRYGIPARARRVALVHFPGATSESCCKGFPPNKRPHNSRRPYSYELSFFMSCRMSI